jgi:hypothetical protein
MRENSGVLERIRRQVAVPSPAFERLQRRRARKARTGRLAAGVVAAVAALAAVGGAFLATSGGRAGSPVAADRGHSGTSPSLVAGPGEYYYSKVARYYANDPTPPDSDRELALDREDGKLDGRWLVGPWTLELWYARDASGRLVFTPYRGADAGGVGYSSFGGAREVDRSYGPGGIPLDDLASRLSADPDELYDQLVDRSSPGGVSPNPIATTSPGRSQEDTSLLRGLDDILSGDEHFSTPELEAALFDVASRIPGVVVEDGVLDPMGRRAVALRWIVQYEGPPATVTWYWDPWSKQFMGRMWIEGDVVLEAQIVLSDGIARSTDDAPAPTDEFFPRAQGDPTFAP